MALAKKKPFFSVKNKRNLSSTKQSGLFVWVGQGTGEQKVDYEFVDRKQFCTLSGNRAACRPLSGRFHNH
jgi:hypothetical protein